MAAAFEVAVTVTVRGVDDPPHPVTEIPATTAVTTAIQRLRVALIGDDCRRGGVRQGMDTGVSPT
jgi:hypothetical protein